MGVWCGVVGNRWVRFARVSNGRMGGRRVFVERAGREDGEGGRDGQKANGRVGEERAEISRIGRDVKGSDEEQKHGLGEEEKRERRKGGL